MRSPFHQYEGVSFLKFLKNRKGFWGLLVLFFLLGCQAEEGYRAANEDEEPGFQRARKLLREGRKEEALQDFLRLIEHRVEAPESHLEAAELYLREFDDPLKAYYHFDRYLALRPHSEHAKLVRGQLLAAQREFIRKLPGNTLSGQLDRLELAGQIEALVNENEALKKQILLKDQKLAELERRMSRVEPLVPPVVTQGPVPGEARGRTEKRELISRETLRREEPSWGANLTGSEDQNRSEAREPQKPRATPQGREQLYKVREGDTLSGISRKVYGHAGGWQEIYQANRDQLTSHNALRPGQILRIPPESESLR